MFCLCWSFLDVLFETLGLPVAKVGGTQNVLQRNPNSWATPSMLSEKGSMSDLDTLNPLSELDGRSMSFSMLTRSIYILSTGL